MVKNVHRFACPCCKKTLEFDARTAKVRPVPTGADTPGGLDDLLASHKHESERLGDVFERAAKDQAGQSRRYDDLLSDAIEDARKNKDEAPRNPFDLE